MSLTKRQTQVIGLMAQGKTAEQCAAALHRSVGTIRRHVVLACSRVDARNVTHLVAKSIANGWVDVSLLALVVVMLNTNVSEEKARNLVRIRVQRSTQQLRREA